MPDRDIGTESVVELLFNVSKVTFREEAAALEQWYELRVVGSAGTAAGNASGTREGISVGEDGRLCSLSSGCARRFDSAQQALDYLGKIKVSGDYQFEAVLCGTRAAA